MRLPLRICSVLICSTTLVLRGWHGTTPVDVHRGLNPRRYGSFVVHSIGRHSNKTALIPPSPSELTKLVQQSRNSGSIPASPEPSRVPTRSLRRRLSPQTIEELVTRYTGGDSIRALSREYGVSRSGLCGLLQKEDVTLREQGVSREGVENAVRLYKSGLTIRQVAEHVGYSYGTIRTALHEHGVALRAGGRRNRCDGNDENR